MKHYTFLASTALAALTLFAGIQARADNMVSIAIFPATGAVTLTPRWAIGGSLAGFHQMAQDLSLGGGANQFYSIKGTTIPSGGDIAAFTRYIAGSGAATNHADIGSKLSPNSYSALTSADPDIGYGAVNFYFIHHKASGDYFTVIKPSSATASAVTDLKPMSGPGGPATLGASGYFGLTFAAANLGYGLNNFYYLRTDSVTGFTKFGTLEPALLGTSADKFDLGIAGHNALVFTGTEVGFGTDKMYYLRLDPVTGYTILGTLHPLTGRASDIANLGSVYSTLAFVPGDVGFGPGQFYATGAVNPTWQSVSFAAIADRAISAGSFTVKPSASSGLAIALTVVSGSTGAASISGPVAGVFTVTPTGPGIITLQARQAGQLAPTVFESNLLRQSFTATGVGTLTITTQPTSQIAASGTTANFSVTASGTTTLSYQWRKGGANITGNGSATTSALSLANVQTVDVASYDVVVSNSSGSISSNAATLSMSAVPGTAPAITNSALTTPSTGTVGTPFNFTITASGSPTSYTASPLPAGLVLNATTGAITGTPTTVGTTVVLLGATNGAGTSNATLTITVAGPAGALFQFPASLARDALGNLYVADAASNTIKKITPAGAVSIVAGTAGAAGSADGTGASARFNQPSGVAVDAALNLYVADTGNATIRKITPAGVVTTLAGAAGVRGNRDDFGSAASFGSPTGIAVDSGGSLYVADAFNATIRKITPAGAVTTLAGAAENRGDADGTGGAARFNFVNGVAVDGAGNVYVADTYNSTIRKITPAGVVTTLAGLPGVSGSTDGTGSNALFNQPYGVAVDSAGNVIVADTGNSTLRRILPSGAVTTVAGIAGVAGLRDGPGKNALFNQPRGVAVDSSENIYVADTGNGTIRRVTPDGIVSSQTMAAALADGTTTPPAGGTTPPAAQGGSGSASGGGGAFGPWFAVLLALIGAARLWPRAQSREA